MPIPTPEPPVKQYASVIQYARLWLEHAQSERDGWGNMPAIPITLVEDLVALLLQRAQEIENWRKLGESVRIEDERLQALALELGLSRPTDRQGYEGRHTQFSVIADLKAQLTARAQEIEQVKAKQPKPESWFNQVCAALGLFAGARPTSAERVLWDEVLPTIEALKANAPEAGVLVREQERVYGLWRDALAKMVEANRRADGFLSRWHEVEADRQLLRQQLAAADAALVSRAPQQEQEEHDDWSANRNARAAKDVSAVSGDAPNVDLAARRRNGLPNLQAGNPEAADDTLIAAPLPASAALQALIAEWRRSADCVEREIQPGGIRERFPEGPRYGIAAVRQCADELEAALSRADQP